MNSTIGINWQEIYGRKINHLKKLYAKIYDENQKMKRRLEKSRTIKAEAGTSYKKTSSFFEPAREQLIKIRNEKFKDNPMPNAVVARTLIKRVEDGEDADAVLTEYYLSTLKN